MSAKRPAKRTPAKAKKAGKPEQPSTIGENPLDDLVPAGPVKQVALVRRAKVDSGLAERTTALTITVPRSLAQQVEHILAISPELSFDQLMSTALAQVVQEIKGRHRQTTSGSVKQLATALYRRKPS